MSVLHILILKWSVAFSLSRFLFELCNLVIGGLFEVPVTYLGSLSFFLFWGPVLPNGRSSKRLLLIGGSGVCSLLSLVLYPKCAHSASQTLPANYLGFKRCTPLSRPITITWIVSH
jgi:hypothetical protein